MNLEDLIGLHTLSGFDNSIPNNDNKYEELEEGVCFILDGKKYQIYTNPSDGYRSYISSLYEDDSVKCQNTGWEEKVFITKASMLCDYDSDADPKGIIIYSMEGQIIAEIYTDYYDSFYPRAICRWHPENMLINKRKDNQ